MNKRKMNNDRQNSDGRFDDKIMKGALGMKKHKTVKRVGLFAAAAIAAFTVLFVSLTSVRRDDVTAAGGQNNVLSSKTATITTEQIAETTETAIASESQKILGADGDIVMRYNGFEPIKTYLTISPSQFLKEFQQADDDTLFYVMLDVRFSGIRKKLGELSQEDYEKPSVYHSVYDYDTLEYYDKYYRALKEREKEYLISALKDIGVNFEYKPYGYYIGYMKKSDFDKMKDIVTGVLVLLPEDFSFEEWHEQYMSKRAAGEADEIGSALSICINS